VRDVRDVRVVFFIFYSIITNGFFQQLLGSIK